MKKTTNNSDNERSIKLSFRVNKDEKEIIEMRAVKAKKKSLSAYLRKISLTGVIVNYDNQQLKDLRKSIVGIQTNINQIADRVNATNRFYEEDLNYIKKEVNEIWQSLKSVELSLRSLWQ